MKARAIIITVIAVLSCAAPAIAADSAQCNKIASCSKGVDVYQFQDASDAIAGFHMKLWPTQPMKALGPVKRKDFMGFQRIADSIQGNWTDFKENCKTSDKK